MNSGRAEWSNKMVFILAAAGSAVGLGNIWRFPYITGENGGGTFVLLYLVCVFLIGLTIMVAELLIGRATKLSPIMAFRKLGGKFGKYWQIIGWLGVFAAFILVSYYSVIGGWTLAYVFKSLTMSFAGLEHENAGQIFTSFTSDPVSQIFWTFVFIAIGVVVVIRGIKGGLEAFNKIFMPALFGMIIILVINALTNPSGYEGLKFFFYPDFSKVKPDIILAALGQAFFSLSLGMGAILTYGSYLNKDESLIHTSSIVILLDSLVAILIGVAIFPVLFAVGMSPAQGPGLTFITLPVAFSKFGNLGPILITVFFLVLSFAAITSVISIIEPVVSHFVDSNTFDRKKGTLIVGILAFVLSIPSALSNGANEFFSGSFFMGKNFLEFADFIVSDNILPIGGFSMALFVVFVVSKKVRHEQVTSFYYLWKTLLPISAVAVAAVYLNNAWDNPIWFGVAIFILVIIAGLVFISKGTNDLDLECVVEIPENKDELE